MDVKKAIGGLVLAGALAGGVYEGTVSDGPRNVIEPGELVSHRTATAKHFRVSDGVNRAKIYTEPVHWLDGDEWKTLDLEVKPKPILRRLLSSRPFEATAGPFTADFPEEKTHNYRFSAGGASVEYAARFDTSKAVDIETRVISRGVKETVTLKGEAPALLEWDVAIDGEVRPEGDGWAVYADSVRAFGIEALTAWDAKGAPVKVSATLEKGVLSARVDTEGAEWPETVDPSTTVTPVESRMGFNYYSSGDWPSVRKFTNGAVNSTQIQVGVSYATGYTVERGHMKLDLSGFDPTGKTITGIALKLYGQTDYSATDFDVYAVASFIYGNSIDGSWHNDFYGWSANSNDTYSIISYGSFYTSAFTTKGYNTLNFNSAGIDSARTYMGADKPKMGITLLGSKDITPGAAPENHHAVIFRDDSSGPDYTPYLEITWFIPDVNNPSRFRLSPIGRADSLAASWTNNHSSSITTLKLGRVVGAGDTVWTDLGSKTATSARIGGLNPYTKYTFLVRADSAGYFGHSAPDDMFTLQEIKRVEIPVDTMHGVFPTATARYDSARAETLADSLTDRSYPVYAIGQSTGQTTYRGRVNRVSYTLPKLTMAQLKYPVRACTTLVTLNEDSTATDFTIKTYKGTWKGLGTVVDWFKSFVGWKPGMAAYDGVSMTEDVSTTTLDLYGGGTKLPSSTAGLDTLNQEIARGDSIRRVFLSSRDVSATAPSGNELFYVSSGAGYTWLILYAALADSAPTGLALTPLSATSMRAAWTDRAHSERGYILVDSATGAAVSDTLGANTTTVDIDSLDVNTRYVWKVKALGGGANGQESAAVDEYTLPNTPGAPTVSFPADTLMTVTLDPNGNPGYTPFNLMATTSTPGETLWVDFGSAPPRLRTWGTATLDSAWAWASYSDHGGAIGVTLPAGVGRKYTWAARGLSGRVDTSFVLLDLPLAQGYEATGPELVSNGDFSAWTGDNPVGWTVSTENANNYVTEASGKARMVSDGTYIDMGQVKLTLGKTYRYSVDVDTVIAGGVVIRMGGVAAQSYVIDSTGNHSGILRAVGVIYHIARVGTTDITFDNVTSREYWLTDLSPHARRAYPQNAPSWVTLPSGLSVMDFNGSTDLLQVGTEDWIGTGDVTFEAWVRPETAGAGEKNIYGRILDNGKVWLGIYEISGDVRFYYIYAG